MRLSTSTFSYLQFGVITGIVLLCTANYVLAAFFEQSGLRIIAILDVGTEASLPTWFSVLNLSLASVLAAGLAVAHRGQPGWLAPYWLLLALLMLGLSLDESVQMHEKLLKTGANLAPQLPQIASHGWVVLGALFTLACGLLFLPFLWRLPRRLAAGMCIAGAVYVAGALGLESFGAVADYHGWLAREDLLYQLRRIGEEGLEMYGIALFNCILYAQWAAWRLTFTATSGYKKTLGE